MNDYSVVIYSDNRRPLARRRFQVEDGKIDEFFDDYLGTDSASDELLNSDVSMSKNEIIIKFLFNDDPVTPVLEELATFFGSPMS